MGCNCKPMTVISNAHKKYGVMSKPEKIENNLNLTNIVEKISILTIGLLISVLFMTYSIFMHIFFRKNTVNIYKLLGLKNKNESKLQKL